MTNGALYEAISPPSIFSTVTQGNEGKAGKAGKEGKEEVAM
jgi:hypothetical protein